MKYLFSLIKKELQVSPNEGVWFFLKRSIKFLVTILPGQVLYIYLDVNILLSVRCWREMYLFDTLIGP